MDILSAIDLNSSITGSEIYIGDDLEIKDLDLSIKERELAEFKLYQNKPNPFMNKTTIEFNLPVESPYTLTISDIDGKILWQVNGEGKKGMNYLEIDKHDLKAGLLVYKLFAGRNSGIRKMILLN